MSVKEEFGVVSKLVNDVGVRKKLGSAA